MLHNSTVALRLAWPKGHRAAVIKVLDIIGAAKVRLFFNLTKLFSFSPKNELPSINIFSRDAVLRVREIISHLFSGLTGPEKREIIDYGVIGIETAQCLGKFLYCLAVVLTTCKQTQGTRSIARMHVERNEQL